MSRVGKNSIPIPAGVNVALNGNILTIKKGGIEEIYKVPDCLKVEESKESIRFIPLDSNQSTRALWGTSQRNVNNIIVGLSDGFKIELEMVGVGYKAAVSGKKLTMQLGFSHDIVYDIPDRITIACPKPTTMVVSGHCKKQVGDVAAVLRGYRPPEPYKGKGVMRVGEFVYRKEGKKK
ncbi:MAG: 50S ribosomal protein L6 [Holosporales bacterium]|jgi:large subunit ribosomal protein L6|nr:50S ribosomal protein L6 [Holosporales bacterium]